MEKICSDPKLFFNCVFTNGLLLFLTWIVPWSILGEHCLPGSNIFGLIILYDCCVLAGAFVHAIPIPKLPPLPPLLGMLLAGFALRNIPVINVAKDIDPNWSSALRSLALTVILVKAGLELDASALKTMKGVCIRLTALPCLTETFICSIMCYLLLGFSWEWGIMLGFVLGAVTPAVIVPSLLLLQEKGFGTDQGIPTLVIAASSFDDVLAISGFSILLGVTFSGIDQSEVFNSTTFENATTNPFNNTEATFTSTPASGQTAGQIALTIVRGPLEMIGGIIVGILIGVVLWYIPDRGQKHVSRIRTSLVFGVGVLAVFGTGVIGFQGSGALIAIVAPFMAGFRWKEDKIPISENMGSLWKAFEPFLFGLIGAEITVESMDASTVGLGLLVLFIGLLFRTLATFGAVFGGGFTWKEKLFVSLAWLPKATVQAAIGPFALDRAKKANAPDDVLQTAKQILTIAVLSILITAPLGAAAITLSGPKLLQRSKVEDKEITPLTEIAPPHGLKNDHMMGDEIQKLALDYDEESEIEL